MSLSRWRYSFVHCCCTAATSRGNLHRRIARLLVLVLVLAVLFGALARRLIATSTLRKVSSSTTAATAATKSARLLLSRPHRLDHVFVYVRRQRQLRSRHFASYSPQLRRTVHPRAAIARGTQGRRSVCSSTRMPGVGRRSISSAGVRRLWL